jgi:adenine phosphoribosyltransferase
MNIKEKIKTVDNFPKQGVKFLDVTTIFEDPEAFNFTVNWFSNIVEIYNVKSIVAVDARGFICGGAVASKKGIPLFLARKSGKLPGGTLEMEYDTEYSSARIALKVQQKITGPVLVIDDILATGGTMDAVGALLTEGWKVSPQDQVHGAIVDLSFLGGKEKLTNKGYKVASLVTY